MSIRLVAVDIDDTLITDELFIPEMVKEAIAAARSKGVKVVLATGACCLLQFPLPRSWG